MNELIKNSVAAIVDVLLFFVLWLWLGIYWPLAFFLSTSIVVGGWWMLAWANYLLKGE